LGPTDSRFLPRILDASETTPGVLGQLVPHIIGENVTYLHIAITSDNANPLLGNAGGYLPMIFVAGDGHNHWDQEAERFGWINWDNLNQMAQGWGQSQFLASYALNQHFLQEPEPPPAQPPAWPANRPQVGVSIVHVPNYAPDTHNTAVHFSWSGNSCAIRNYLHAGQQTNPQNPNYVRTLDVLPMIQRENLFGRNRPPCGDVQAWQAIITDTNRAWELPGNAPPQGGNSH
jgi:hypothetical protein